MKLLPAQLGCVTLCVDFSSCPPDCNLMMEMGGVHMLCSSLEIGWEKRWTERGMATARRG